MYIDKRLYRPHIILVYMPAAIRQAFLSPCEEWLPSLRIAASAIGFMLALRWVSPRIDAS